jgi:hypothetical protein
LEDSVAERTATRDELITELREVEKDLFAFKQMRDILHSRLREMEDNPARHSLVSDWPVFRVVENGLIIAMVKCEGLAEDYRRLLDQEPVDNVIQLREET